MSNKVLSVIIVNYKSEDLLKKCIASVFSKLPANLDFEVVVVNNDENDLALAGKNWEKIRIINHKKNIGFGAGANLGAAEAQGEILFFLNPDSEINSDNVKEILDYFSQNIQTAAIGAKVVSPSGAVQPWIAGKKTNVYDLIRNNLRFPRSRKIWEGEKIISADWVAGTALFVRRKDFDAVGGFDSRFFMYFEDMDLCQRLRKNEKEIFFFPFFRVKHLNGQSYADKKKQKKDYYASQEYYFQKHCGSLQTAILKIAGKIFN